MWFSKYEKIHHPDSNVLPSAYCHTLLHSKFIRARFLSRPVPTNRWGKLTPSPRAAGTIIKNLRAIFQTRKRDCAGAWTHAHHAQKRTIYAPTSTDSARDIRAQPKIASSWKGKNNLPLLSQTNIPWYILGIWIVTRRALNSHQVCS